MHIPHQKTQKEHFQRYSKARSSGIKEVSVKNNRSIDSFTKTDKQYLRQNHDNSSNEYISRVLPDRKLQYKKSATVPSQFIQTCLKPNLLQNQNTLILEQNIDSRIILKIHSTQKDKHHFLQSKSKGIKIGLKAQKHRQNNKSQPKKVFDIQNLSTGREKCQSVFESKDLKKQEAMQSKKTQRKNSPNIFVCTKNIPASSEIGTKLKKFQEDLKKTKKPQIMKLQLQKGRNDYKIPDTKFKSMLSLKNHQLDPKFEPLVCNDLKILPSPQIYCQRIQNSLSILPASKLNFSYGLSLKRQQINALQKTKRITSNFIEDFEMFSPRFQQQMRIVSETYNPNNIDGLIPSSEMKFVLDRLCSNSKKTNQNMDMQKNNPPKPHSIQSISFASPPLSEIKIQKQSQFQEKQIKIFTFKELENPRIQNNQALSLRTTDYLKHVQAEPDSQSSALSQRRNIVFKTNQKTSGAKGKIQSLNEAAKTIITKYDSSEKRSIVDESIIIFQCSKDLKQSFSRDVMDTYAAKYRGSLGVKTLIRENQEDQMHANEQDTDQYQQNHQLNGFENILFNPNSNNGGKLRKSFSIKEVQASIRF